MQRLNNLTNCLTQKNQQVGQKSCLGTIGVKKEDDVVIVSALRTPMTRARRGGLSQTAPELMLAHVFDATLKRTKIDPKLVGDVQVGNVLMPGAGALIARAAMFMCDMPTEVPCSATNRQCSSGLEACAIIAAKIKAGLIGKYIF